MDRTFVVIGAGEAGGTAVQTLRAEGFDGKIVLVGGEEHSPYERPPLSKGYLKGEPYASEGSLEDRQWYEEQGVDLHLGQRAASVDRAAHEVVLDDGQRLHYDKLLIATGATPRLLDIPGADLDNVYYLRTLEDSEKLSKALQTSPDVVVVGGGWIGLEVSAVAREKGSKVTVLEPNSVPLEAAMGADLGRFFADLHRSHGVEFRFGHGVTEFRGSTKVEAVVTDDGTEIPADLVVVGVGIRPEVSLFDEGMLARDGGVRVDAQMRTDDPDVFAAGDIASIDNPLYGHRIRVEHWANALMTGKIAAQSMLDKPSELDPAPFFFSDQYDMSMEYAGWADARKAAPPLIRGDVQKPAFHAFWLDDGVVIAGMHVNEWDEGIAPVQELIRGRVHVDPSKLTDPSVPLADLLPKA